MVTIFFFNFLIKHFFYYFTKIHWWFTYFLTVFCFPNICLALFLVDPSRDRKSETRLRNISFARTEKKSFIPHLFIFCIRKEPIDEIKTQKSVNCLLTVYPCSGLVILNFLLLLEDSCDVIWKTLKHLRR